MLALAAARTVPRVVVAASLRGALVGLPTLGLLGRLAMTAFAMSTGRAPTFTTSGTLTVLGMGAAFGALLGPFFALLRRRLPRGGLGGVAFGAIAMIALSPGITPPWPRTFAFFAPAFVAYGALLSWVWRRE